ncbi:DUF3168 domain-containing protein [Rhizobium sp. DKSPLA3]|uniref:DUF3168 domain-containing protein n=1 Tax=Rhizobium quercicola TaxID=2901226 RepID=A0A9X1NTI2_9HYPH|nr:DUF3168 domain-containing protein [Rhizobium quercicola]MCD7109709.1 DUF3168 domain-containing protein [Rhizobium quercicola]
MASPELEVQGEVVRLLKADATVTGFSRRIYDQPPTAPSFPYINIGEAQTLRRDATCLEGGDIYLTMHAWSRAVGFPEVRRIADAMVEALHLAPMTLSTNRFISIMHRQTRVFRDPDGITSHAVVEFLARYDKAA